MKYVTPSEVVEYVFCPRFIYYMNVLGISQGEEDRYLVQRGRNIHEMKRVRNKSYIRKKIGVIDKNIDVHFYSYRYKLVGRVDEVLFLENDFAAPLDYKYAFWENKVYKTSLLQQALYSILIEENYKKTVKNAYLVYTRSKNHIEKLTIGKKLKNKAVDIVEEIFSILNMNFYPKATRYKTRCNDCTYRNLCNV